MSESFKICPICEAHNHKNAVLCNTCGTALTGVAAIQQKTVRDEAKAGDYDFRYGETDLQETALKRPARLYFLIGSIIFLVIAGTGILTVLRSSLLNAEPTLAPTIPPTNSPAAPGILATVTIGPPTATLSLTPSDTPIPSATPTREPCVQIVQAGDSLSGVVARCGHFSRDILDQVVDDNNLLNANSIAIGQQLIIPWPTLTPDPNALPTATPIVSANLSNVDTGNFLEVNEELDAFAPTATATLPPGVMWHEIQPQENLSVIIIEYDADVKTLSELNPEVDFSSCEFGPKFGGENCSVSVGIGQLIRVPAPTPVPTLSPTPDPNATATPTPTATINIPVAESPADRSFFGIDELVTLRWLSSGILSADEVYRVDVIDTTAGIQYTALTPENNFRIPPEWRGTIAARHDFTWTVGIVSQNSPDDIRYPTPTRIFVWQGFVATSEAGE